MHKFVVSKTTLDKRSRQFHFRGSSHKYADTSKLSARVDARHVLSLSQYNTTYILIPDYL